MTTTGAGMRRHEARWAIQQSGVTEMHNVLTYAEAFAIVAAGVGVTTGSPARLVRKLVLETLRGTMRWDASRHTFPTHLCKAVRLEIAGRMMLHARLRRREAESPLWGAQLAEVQVGDLRGVERLAHFAGEMMSSLRSDDGRTLEAAITLADFVRLRLTPFVGEPDEEDTARITMLVRSDADDPEKRN